MAITDRYETKPKLTEIERQARLDALFATRDAMIAAGEIEIWDIDRINEYVRQQRERPE